MSLLLFDKFWSELDMPQNNGIRRNPVYLIEGILGEDGPGTIYTGPVLRFRGPGAKLKPRGPQHKHQNYGLWRKYTTVRDAKTCLNYICRSILF